MTSRRQRPLTPGEDALWKAATRNDKPLDRKDVLPPPEAPRPKRRHMAAPSAPEPDALAASTSPGSFEMDGNLASRLRRGQLPIDGTIDLHGMTLRQAEDRLNSYVAGALALGSRVILVVTGKGALPPEPHERDYMPERPRPGAIRAQLPGWLERGPHAGHILAVQPAQPRHGGGGAFYVLLRRRRDR
jgi:DNA-nicking Smr family endonuclease